MPDPGALRAVPGALRRRLRRRRRRRLRAWPMTGSPPSARWRQDAGGAPITRAALTQAAGFAGVSGIFRLLPNGTNERGLAIAQIRNNQVVVIDPAPRSFGGAGF